MTSRWQCSVQKGVTRVDGRNGTSWKSNGKGACVGRLRRDSTLRLVWHQFADSFKSPSPSPFPLDWHSTSVSFRDFRADSRNGKSDEGFGFHDRKEGWRVRTVLSCFDEDTRDSRNRPLNFPFNLGIHDSHPGSYYLSGAPKRVYIDAGHSVNARQSANKRYECTYISRYFDTPKALRKNPRLNDNYLCTVFYLKLSARNFVNLVATRFEK